MDARLRSRTYAWLCGAWLAAHGCDRGTPEAHERPPAPHAQTAVVAPSPEPTKERGPLPPQPGLCATAQACEAEASASERAGQLHRAAPLYARACELGLGAACYRLGELHRDGKGVPADDGQARALFVRGCEQGSTSACDALGH